MCQLLFAFVILFMFKFSLDAIKVKFALKCQNHPVVLINFAGMHRMMKGSLSAAFLNL